MIPSAPSSPLDAEFAALRKEVRNFAAQLRDAATAAAAKLDAASDAGDKAAAQAMRSQLHDTSFVVESLQAQLATLRAQAESTAVQTGPHGDSPDWVAKEQSALAEAFAKDPLTAMSQWLGSCADLVGAWKLDDAATLAQAPFAFAHELAHRADLVREGVEALRSERNAAAVPMLEFLLMPAHPLELSQPELRSETRVALLIVLARIRAMFVDPPQLKRAGALLALATSVRPQDRHLDAAWSDWYHRKNDQTQAFAYAQQALERAPDVADSYITMGAKLEEEGAADRADEMYERAADIALAESDPLSAFGRHLVPVPPAAWLALALRLHESRPRDAIAAIERALATPDANGSQSRTVEMLTLKADWLAQLGERDESASALFAAGEDLYRSGDYAKARKFLEQAISRDAGLLPAYWVLADDLLQLSMQDFSNSTADPIVLREAIDAWERARARQVPAGEHTWAYVSRAFMSAHLANTPEVDSWSGSWDAVAWLEQAFVLQPPDARWWSNLAMFYRTLSAGANALYAMTRARAEGAREPFALSEHAAILANRGEWEPAMEIVDELLADESLRDKEAAWLKAVKTYILRGKHQYPEALDAVGQALEADPVNVWYRGMLASTLKDVGRVDEAVAVWGKIWDERHDPRLTSTVCRALWAGLELARHANRALLTEVTSEFRRLAALPREEKEARRGLAWALLMAGEAEGKQHLQWAFDGAVNARELDGFEEELENYGKVIDPELLRGVRTALGERRAKGLESKTPEAELRELLNDEPPGSKARLGMLASLARLQGTEDPESAADIYRDLLVEEQRFPQARAALVAAVDKIGASIDGLIRDDDASAALVRLEKARELAGSAGDRRQLAEMEVRTVFARALSDHSSLDLPTLANAWDGLAETAVSRPDVLAERVNAMVASSAQLWALDAQLGLAAKEAEASLAHQLQRTRRALMRQLDLLHGLSDVVAGPPRMTKVAPLRVQMGAKLVRATPSESFWPHFTEHLVGDARKRLRERFGIRLPDVTIDPQRSWQDPESESAYVVMIADSPVETGVVPPDANVLEFLAAEVERVAARELFAIFDAQEAARVLHAWSERDQALADRIQRVLPGVAHRHGFGQVLRALLREQVSLRRADELIEVLDPFNLDLALATRVAHARAALKSWLPGNGAEDVRVPLPEPCLSHCDALVNADHGEPFVAATAEDLQLAIAELRDLSDHAPARAAFVVDQDATRYALQRLVAITLGSNPVLTRHEAHDLFADGQRTTLDTERA